MKHISLLAACLALFCIACTRSDADQKLRLMVWSPSEDQSLESGMWLQTVCSLFAQAHPEWDITFVYGVADEATAATIVAQDPEVSADVFMYANDTLTLMTDAHALAKFGGKYADEIRATNSQEVLESVVKDGFIYGIPYTTNTWFMYYDTAAYSPEDVKSLDRMLEKGVVSFPFTNSWYLQSFYIANGCTLFNDGTDEDAGVNFSGDKAVEVTNYLIDLVQRPNFRVDAGGSGIAGMRDGSVQAIFSGSWDANAVREALGDHMGIAALPTFTLNGKELQLYSFAGSKAIGVNPHSEHMVQAVELALFLASDTAQALHYELRKVIPCNTELLARPEIAADPLVAAQNDTVNRTSILQPFVAAMNNVWVPVENMGNGIRNGTITRANARKQTERMNAAMNSVGL